VVQKVRMPALAAVDADPLPADPEPAEATGWVRWPDRPTWPGSCSTRPANKTSDNFMPLDDASWFMVTPYLPASPHSVSPG
jgi:hypothetical protein